jgi:hypothetical protein
MPGVAWKAIPCLYRWIFFVVNYIWAYGYGESTQLSRLQIVLRWDSVAKRLKQKYLKED